MLQIMTNNLKNRKFSHNDIKYILELTNQKSITKLYEKSQEIQNKFHEKTLLETNIYYPQFYSLEDNCPTCGYKTPESHKKYNPIYIKNILDYKLQSINQYPIKSINCYSTDGKKVEELKLILKILKGYNIPINLKLDNLDNYSKIKHYNINSLIIDYSLTNQNPYTSRCHEYFKKNRDKLSKIIKENSNINIACEIIINYRETHIDLKNTIDNLIKINPNVIEILGYDPFYDTPQEYNPQYSQDYLKKIIAILRIIFPKTKLKIKYATNNNNDLENNLKLGINIISGVYFDKNNPKTYNIQDIMKILF